MQKKDILKNKNILKNPIRLFNDNSLNKAIVFGVAILFILNISSAVTNTAISTASSNRNIEWDVTLLLTETGGKNDYIIFGEAPDASDGVDSYDAPNPPNGPEPFLDAYVTTNLPWPYNRLLQEIKKYPNTHNIWNFTVWWTGSDTTVTISWNTAEINASEYNNVMLCDGFGVPFVNMLNNDNYTFFCPSSGMVQFQIICSSNQPPVANDDNYDTPEDTALTIPAPGVLDNDIDDDGLSPLTAELVDDVSHGILVLDADGSFVYTPDLNFNGDDTFAYRAYDGEDYSNVATVTITVDPVNDDPVANDDTATVEEYSSDNQIDVLDNDYDIDGDTLEVIGVTTPDHGTATYDEDYVYYTPEDGYSGYDSFTYTITDNNGSAGVSATVDVTVIENAPPEKPDKPSGETRGKVGEEYTYTTSTTDINDDQLYYNFAWGDDATSGWVGPYESGETAEASHMWNTRGNYEIKVKAKDEHGLESEWSDPLPISMPLSRDDTTSDKSFVEIQSFYNQNIQSNFFGHGVAKNLRDFINLILAFLRENRDGSPFDVFNGRWG